ncbi:unnamed protein product [Coffea canephora]|uniref:DC1 domain-containing protein n=1 Tax=Coffea canephora TaxID=49390 RepID=A0A068TRM1_COFCA|nr:unnamed protein product [Coffea canephora]
MGRIDNAPSPKMKHFSHPHELELWSGTTSFQSHQQTLMPTDSTTTTTTLRCSACQLTSTENMYICRPCNFSLHLSCAQFPRVFNHPAHKNHVLTLLPVAAYAGGIFNCDACNRRGNGFSYHCGSCEYDLHVLCASKPLRFTHPSHFCQLELTFTNPYGNAKGFSCDVCHKFGSKQWLYRCSACEFDVHLDCTTVPTPTTTAPTQVKHQGPFPTRYIHSQVGLGQSAEPTHQQYMHSARMVAVADNSTHRPQMGPTDMALMGVGPILSGPPIAGPDVSMPSASTGQLGNYWPMGQVMDGPPLVRPNVLMHSASAGQLGYVSPVGHTTSGLMNSAMQGIVEGGGQQVGQTLVQGVIGGGGSGGGGDGGWGGDGTSIPGSLFDDSLYTQN